MYVSRAHVEHFMEDIMKCADAPCRCGLLMRCGHRQCGAPIRARQLGQALDWGLERVPEYPIGQAPPRARPDAAPTAASRNVSD